MLGTRDEIGYEKLIRIGRALAQRAEEPKAILAVVERLEGAWAEHQAGEEIFRDFVERLLSLDSETAERTLDRLALHHRFRREHPEWKPPQEGEPRVGPDGLGDG